MMQSRLHQTEQGKDAFPWDLLMSIALQGLGWEPSTFWQTTPKELVFAVSAINGNSEHLDRSTLDALLASFPDDQVTSMKETA